MAKNITFVFEGKTYTLEFSKTIVKQMENEGFVSQDIDKRPMTILPALFAGAFRLHHKKTPQAVIDRIYKSMTNKEALISALGVIYNDPLLELLEEPDPDAEGNVEWVTSW